MTTQKKYTTDFVTSKDGTKTHVSNLYLKMDVKSRTQAIGKAKKLKIIE
jgi:ATP/maltotriose-dependent transcriptional regulator MalT